jgi:hypothetical protein
MSPVGNVTGGGNIDDTIDENKYKNGQTDDGKAFVDYTISYSGLSPENQDIAREFLGAADARSQDDTGGDANGRVTRPEVKSLVDQLRELMPPSKGGDKLTGGTPSPQLKISDIKDERLRKAAEAADKLGNSPSANDGYLSIDELARASRIANGAVDESKNLAGFVYAPGESQQSSPEQVQ